MLYKIFILLIFIFSIFGCVSKELEDKNSELKDKVHQLESKNKLLQEELNNLEDSLRTLTEE